MFLACVEIAADSGATQGQQNPGQRSPGQQRVLQLAFNDFEPAKIWASEESARRGDATGNAAVFETAGPLMVLAWELDGVGAEERNTADKMILQNSARAALIPV